MKKSLKVSTRRHITATKRRFAASRSDFGGREYEGTSASSLKIASCVIANVTAILHPARHLGRLPGDQPFATLYLDIVGGQGSLSLGATSSSILSMIDGFTGWAEAVPISDQRAKTVADAVFTHWIARYGVPEQIHSDRGVQFESALFEELCSTLGTDKTRTTPYRPQANGKCERFNRTLVSMLRRAVQKRPYDWEPLLPAVLQAYRSTPSESTGFTPHFLAFGREMRLPVDFGSPLPEPARDVRSYGSLLAENLEWAYGVAREDLWVSARSCCVSLQPAARREIFRRGRSRACHSPRHYDRRSHEACAEILGYLRSARRAWASSHPS